MHGQFSLRDEKKLYYYENCLSNPLLFYKVFLKATQDQKHPTITLFILLCLSYMEKDSSSDPFQKKFPINTNYVVTNN